MVLYRSLLAVTLGVSAAVAGYADGLVTWTRELTPPPAQTLKNKEIFITPGRVVLTREAPAGPSAAQLEERLRDIQHQQDALKDYTALQIELAEARAAKEAIAATMAMANQHVQTQTAASEARLRDESRQQLKQVQQLADVKLETLTQLNQKQEALTQTQLAGLTQTVEQRLKGLELQTAANQKIAQLELAQLRSSLEQHAQSQLAAVQAQTAATVASLAAEHKLAMDNLTNATAEHLADIYTRAQTDAATLVEARTAALRSQMEILTEKTLSPAQVTALAAQTMAEAAPEFQALALQTLKASEGYVKTVARQAVADNDPAMQQALGNAVALALNEERSPAAFSMRRAIVNELTAAQGEAAVAPSTRLGDDMVAAIEPAAGEEAVDAARLRLGRLLNPSEGIVPHDNPTQSATLTPNHDPRTRLTSLSRAKARTDLMDLRDYKVVMHADNLTLPVMLEQVLSRAEPFAGPWQLRWRLKPENEDLLRERFSLDAETTFNEFVSYLAQYLINDRGVKLTFSLFDRERVVLVSD